MKRVTVAVIALLALSACGTSSPGQEPDPAPSAPTEQYEEELPPGFDEEPDGEIVPDSALTPAELTALLRLTATDPATAQTCAPGEVEAKVTGLDAAAGHRYGRIVLTNISTRACTLSGYPGIGARGEWGNTFQLAAEHRDSINPDTALTLVTLAPGAAAYANLEWTGELAGAESEKASMLVIQLAQGQDAFGFPAVGEIAADSGDQSGQPAPLDIGIQTTVRIGPLQLAVP